jgi:hypothetical protein
MTLPRAGAFGFRLTGAGLRLVFLAAMSCAKVKASSLGGKQINAIAN